MDFDKKEKHPSYGMVQFSRISGGSGNMFGSSVKHHHFIRLRIVPGSIMRDLSREWFSGDIKPFIEVDLSPYQYAELLTTMNCGSGVPCTIRRLHGQEVEGPPSRDGEMVRMENEFKETAKDVAAALDDVLAMLNKSGPLSATERKEALSKATKAKRGIEANMPFLKKSFDENIEEVAADAKSGIDALWTHTIATLGAEALAARVPEMNLIEAKK